MLASNIHVHITKIVGKPKFHKVERHCKPSLGLQGWAQRKQIFMVDFFFFSPSFAIEVFHSSQIAELQKVETLDCQLKD